MQDERHDLVPVDAARGADDDFVQSEHRRFVRRVPARPHDARAMAGGQQIPPLPRMSAAPAPRPDRRPACPFASAGRHRHRQRSPVAGRARESLRLYSQGNRAERVQIVNGESAITRARLHRRGRFRRARHVSTLMRLSAARILLGLAAPEARLWRSSPIRISPLRRPFRRAQISAATRAVARQLVAAARPRMPLRMPSRPAPAAPARDGVAAGRAATQRLGGSAPRPEGHVDDRSNCKDALRGSSAMDRRTRWNRSR